MDNQMSELKVYSLGIVAANKPLSTRVIEVTPIETSPMAHGELTDNVSNYTAGGKDQENASYQVDVQTTGTVKATWLPLGSSNRMTAPDVRRGEHVVLYRFADADEFWWTTLKDDMNLRKLETVIYAFSATTDEHSATDASNAYFLEISTHQKLVHFHTSKANGEPFAYDIQINAGEGCITIQDDAGNYFFVNSKDTRMKMQNVSGSFVDIDKDVIKLNAPSLIKSTAPLWDHTGNMVVNGNQTINGNFNTKKVKGAGGKGSIEGDLVTNGRMDVTEGMNVGQVLQADKVVSNQPIEAPNV